MLFDDKGLKLFRGRASNDFKDDKLSTKIFDFRNIRISTSCNLKKLITPVI